MSLAAVAHQTQTRFTFGGLPSQTHPKIIVEWMPLNQNCRNACKILIREPRKIIRHRNFARPHGKTVPRLIMLALRYHGDHYGDIKWKHFPRYWPFVRGIHRWPVNFPHKGQWRGALKFSLICARIKGWETIAKLVIWDAIALIMTSL